MIATTYLIYATSCIMVGAGCLSIGFLIGKYISRSDRYRLGHFDHMAREREENRERRENYLAGQQMLYDGEAIRDGELCVHDDCYCTEDEGSEPVIRSFPENGDGNG